MPELPNHEVAIFSSALELPPEQRAAYLDKACAGDTALRQLLESLLQAHDQAGDFLEPPPREGATDPSAALQVHLIPDEAPGNKIGGYKLLQEIGEGGCGVVYMAEQQQPVRRRVALKIVKIGTDKGVVARFEAEQQALALMDHPNIARVFDAGITSKGRPYFVMELVKGVPITEFCDQNSLSTRERLELFIKVCQAVQHAHQKGIIHRDIKPTNVLVTLHDGVPVPKVIDFGVAKAIDQRLTEKTLFTAFGQFIGTPAYMSPEQAEMSGLDIDTRSDIYSLGALLYELLTGCPPFEIKELLDVAFDEMRRTIREKEPPKPSTRLSTMAADALTTTAQHRQSEPPKLIHLVRGDLDWIVMKCLEKDRTRRYETANGLAMDIRRNLNSEPIVARPPSAVYRFQKMAHRNKAVFAAVSAVAAALVIGLIVSTSLYFKAQGEKRKAQTEAAKSQQVVQFLNDMLNSAGQSVVKGGERTMPSEMLEQTAERAAKELRNQPDVEAGLLTTIGGIDQLLGEYGKAEEMYRQALAMRRKMFGDEHIEVAQSLGWLGGVLWNEGKLDEAESLDREALKIRKRLLGDEHPSVAQMLINLGLVVRDQGKLAEAETLFRQSLAIRKKFYGEEDIGVTWSLANLAVVLQDQGKPSEAEPLFSQVLSIRTKLLGSDNLDVAHAQVELASLLQQEGKAAQARLLAEAAVAFCRRHPDRVSGWLEVTAFDTLMRSLKELGDAPAVKSLEESWWQLLRGHAEKGDAQAMNELAWLVATSREPELRDGPIAIRFGQKAVQATGRENASYLNTLAAAYAENGQFEEAVQIQKEALALLRTEIQKKDYTLRLKLYESNTPYRSP